MQDLQSIVLGVIAGLITNYIQKEIEAWKGKKPLSIEMLTTRFWGSFISAIALLLIFPQIVGNGWYLMFIRIVFAFIAAGCCWGCVGAFNHLREMYNERGKVIADNCSNSTKNLLIERQGEETHKQTSLSTNKAAGKRKNNQPNRKAANKRKKRKNRHK